MILEVEDGKILAGDHKLVIADLPEHGSAEITASEKGLRAVLRNANGVAVKSITFDGTRALAFDL